ncbi:MAG: glycosyltransferase [Deltaproteobacteria bacterium TMED126]|nr:glycosyltransferase [Deltaproteobacteria bacterium TMED126]
MSMISIIGSCKNEENNIDELYSQIKLLFENKLKDHELELILIDNASTDLTVEKIKKLCLNDSRVKLIENIKDYGQDKSPYYAFIQSSGDYIVPIVTDLQDPIKLIDDLYNEIKFSKTDMVLAVPIVEKEGFNFLKKIYYKFMYLTTSGSHIKNFHGFGIYNKKVREYLIKLDDKNPYFRSIVLDTSFTRKVLNYKPDQRYKGSSKNNLFTLIDIGLLGIMTSSQLPLKFAVSCGFGIGILSMLASIIYLILKIIYWDTFQLGIAPLVIGLFFLSSVQLISIGFISQYLNHKIEKDSNSPIVVEKNRINF